MALNKWIGIGRITRDLELKYSQSGTAVCRFSIAVNRPYSKNGEKETDFINIVTFRKSAEFVKNYFKKGDPIQIVGRIQTRQYEDKDGVNRTAVEVVAENIDFVEGYYRKDGTGTTAVEKPEYEEPDFYVVDDDDLPF